MTSVRHEPGKPMYSVFYVTTTAVTFSKVIIPEVRKCVERIKDDIKRLIFDTGMLRDSVNFYAESMGGGKFKIIIFICEPASDYAWYLLHGFWEGGRGFISFKIPPPFWEWVYHHFYVGMDRFAGTFSAAHQKRWGEYFFDREFMSGAWEYLTNKKTRKKEKHRVMRFVPSHSKIYEADYRDIDKFTSLGSLLDRSMFTSENIYDPDVQLIFKTGHHAVETDSKLRDALLMNSPLIARYLDRLAIKLWVSLQKKGFHPVDFWHANTSHLEQVLDGYSGDKGVPLYIKDSGGKRWKGLQGQYIDERLERTGIINSMDEGISPRAWARHILRLYEAAQEFAESELAEMRIQAVADGRGAQFTEEAARGSPSDDEYEQPSETQERATLHDIVSSRGVGHGAAAISKGIFAYFNKDPQIALLAVAEYRTKGEHTSMYLRGKE